MSANQEVAAVKYVVMMPSDSDLVKNSRDEPEVFAIVFDRHFVAIHAFCARRVNSGAAHELASEVFLRAFAGRRTFDPLHGAVRPWLFGIAVNVVREHLRLATRRDVAYQRIRLQRRPETSDPAVAAAHQVDAERDLALVAERLARLPPIEVEALLLHVWEELTYVEIAEVLDVPVGTALAERFSAAKANRHLASLRGVLRTRPGGSD